EEHEIVARAFGRAAERRDALDHVWIECAPMECLQRAHRPARDERKLFDAEFLGHQPVLQAHIVVSSHLRKARAVVGLRRIIGEDDNPLPSMSGMMMKYLSGSSAMPDPTSHSLS